MMTFSETAQKSAEDNRRGTMRTSSAAGSRGARRPVDKILPKELIDELKDIARSAAEITPKVVRDTDQTLKIESRFGISKRRLKNCLQRLSRTDDADKRAADVPISSKGRVARVFRRGEIDSSARVARVFRRGGIDSSQVMVSPRSEDPGHPMMSSASEEIGHPGKALHPSHDQLRTYRTRQASVASILDDTFGPLGKCNPELWDRRAYLMLVGLVYERLSIGEDELPTDELVALAKVLAESRRIEVRARDTAVAGDDSTESDFSKNSPGSTASVPQTLPDRFADVVRQVYGTNFHKPDESPGNKPAST